MKKRDPENVNPILKLPKVQQAMKANLTANMEPKGKTAMKANLVRNMNKPHRLICVLDAKA